jgi:hypothetical protein
VISRAIGGRLFGYASSAFNDQSYTFAGPWPQNQFTGAPPVWRILDPWGFLSSPATWIGALVGAALIAAAIQLRMRRSDH